MGRREDKPVCPASCVSASRSSAAVDGPSFLLQRQVSSDVYRWDVIAPSRLLLLLQHSPSMTALSRPAGAAAAAAVAAAAAA